jgi:hypothetical protein
MPRALDLARRYAEALAALRAVHDFDSWLGEHWHERCPPPVAPPAAQTSLGRSGTISWYEAADTVVGYLPESDGCFRVARESVMPDFTPFADPAGTFDRDILISAEMRAEQSSPDG